MSRPKTWAEAYGRLAASLADEPASREWVREALERLWGVQDPTALERGRRSVAFQKLSGVVLAVEGLDHDVAFSADGRATVAAVFARYFGGAVLEGPPWRLTPYEEAPSYDEWDAGDGFD